MRITIVIASILFTTSYMGVPSHIIATPPTLLQTFEYCRDKLYTKYPDEMLQEEWRDCMNK